MEIPRGMDFEFKRDWFDIAAKDLSQCRLSYLGVVALIDLSLKRGILATIDLFKLDILLEASEAKRIDLEKTIAIEVERLAVVENHITDMVKNNAYSEAIDGAALTFYQELGAKIEPAIPMPPALFGADEAIYLRYRKSRTDVVTSTIVNNAIRKERTHS